MPNTWKQFKEDYILFLEAGLVAVNQADEDSALKLFKAAELLNPANHLTKIGMGYLHLHMYQLKKACELFQEVLEADPSNEMAKAMLGIAMILDPNMAGKAKKILEQTHHSSDKMVQNLSDMGLDFVDKYVKTPPPKQGQHKTK